MKTEAGSDTVPLAKYEEMKSMYDEAQDTIARQAGALDQAQDIIAQYEYALKAMINYMRSGRTSGGIRKLSEPTTHDMADIIEEYMDKANAVQYNRDARGDGRDRIWRRMAILDEWMKNEKFLYALAHVKHEKFEHIVQQVKEHMEVHGEIRYYDLELQGPNIGSRSKLTMRHAVFMTLIKNRTNLPADVIGTIFGIHSSAVSRQCDYINSILENVLPKVAKKGRHLKKMKSD